MDTEQLEQIKNDAMTAIKAETSKIPNASSIKLTGDESLGELRNTVIRKFGSYNENKALDDYEAEYNAVGASGTSIVNNFNDWVRQIEGDERFTEEARITMYEDRRKETAQQLKGIIARQREAVEKSNQLKNTLAERAWQEIQQGEINDLTTQDYAYIDLMIKQGGDREAIAKRFNYNPRVLDILNVGATAYSVAGSNKVIGSDGQTVERKQLIRHPLEKLLKLQLGDMQNDYMFRDPNNGFGTNINTALKNYQGKLFPRSIYGEDGVLS